MATVQEYLDAYDRQLRTDAETPSAVAVTRLGPLRLVTFAGGRGFVTYRDLGGADGAVIARWVEGALAHYREDPGITRVEWKTRGHDQAPSLHDALVRNGFVPGETESIMIGEAALLAVDVPLPMGIHLRRVTGEPDIRALSAMQEEVFGGKFAQEMADALLRRLGFRDGIELWVARGRRRDRRSGRLEPVAATEFAGIWGGATRTQWRRARDLPCAHGGPCTISACAWQEADPQRLDRRVAPDPRTSRTSQGLDDDALPMGGRVGARRHPCCVAWASVRECHPNGAELGCNGRHGDKCAEQVRRGQSGGRLSHGHERWGRRVAFGRRLRSGAPSSARQLHGNG